MWLKDNPESWQYIHEFIAEFLDNDYWSRWKLMAGAVVSGLESRGLASLFRIGQGMHHIMFSTMERHGLTTEPRVTLEFLSREQMVRVAYGCSPLDFGEQLTEERVAPSDAVPTILLYLRRLWCETRPDVQVPEALDVG